VIKSLAALPGGQLPQVADHIAEAALRGARGNSGVILSQIFKGFADDIGGRTRITAPDVTAALEKAYQQAYRSLADPREGTVLTVARESIRAAVEKSRTETDLVVIVDTLLAEARRSLERTPDLLPVLKEAGVVDAGALGYVYILEGISRLLQGLHLPPPEAAEEHRSPGPAAAPAAFYGYCNEFFIHGHDLPAAEIKAALEKLGDSLIVAGGADRIKIHVHSRRPGEVLTAGLAYGTLTDIKIDNIDQQHAERARPAAVPDTAVIAVAPGEGLQGIFRSLGCDGTVDGGQSMNPSVAQFLAAMDRVPARNYILLPNNRNVILAAEQARAVKSGAAVAVVPSRTVPEGFAALLACNRERPLAENAERMAAACRKVKTGEVARAARDSGIRGLEIKTGDSLALKNGGLWKAFPDPETALRALVPALLDAESAVVTVFYGRDTDQDRARAAEAGLRAAHPGLEIEMHAGGQPHYFYIISVE
jgi:uncharacterized protein